MLWSVSQRCLGWAEIYKTSILSHLSSYIKIKEISNDSVKRENSAYVGFRHFFDITGV